MWIKHLSQFKALECAFSKRIFRKAEVIFFMFFPHFNDLQRVSLVKSHALCLTGLFTILEPQNQEICLFFVVQDRCATDFEDPKPRIVGWVGLEPSLPLISTYQAHFKLSISVPCVMASHKRDLVVSLVVCKRLVKKEGLGWNQS